nr:MAG TPA: hypothetical protein [Caudoviricetes sp.]
MIKAEKIGDEIKTTFKGSIGELSQELGSLMENFANEVLGISEKEFLDIFTEAYTIFKNEVQDEVNVH